MTHQLPRNASQSSPQPQIQDLLDLSGPDMRYFIESDLPLNETEQDARSKIECLLLAVDVICCYDICAKKGPASTLRERDLVFNSLAKIMVELTTGTPLRVSDVSLGLALLRNKRKEEELYARTTFYYLDAPTVYQLQRAVDMVVHHQPNPSLFISHHSEEAKDCQSHLSYYYHYNSPVAASTSSSSSSATLTASSASSSCSSMSSFSIDMKKKRPQESAASAESSSRRPLVPLLLEDRRGGSFSSSSPLQSVASSSSMLPPTLAGKRVFVSRESCGRNRNVRFGIELFALQAPVNDLVFAIAYFGMFMTASYGWKLHTLTYPVPGAARTAKWLCASALGNWFSCFSSQNQQQQQGESQALDEEEEGEEQEENSVWWTRTNPEFVVWRRRSLTAYERAFCHIAKIAHADLILSNPVSHPFRPSFFLAVDHRSRSLTLTCRGSLEPHDVVTDALCTSQRIKGGYSHAGFVAGAVWVLGQVLGPVRYLMHRKLPQDYRLNLIGHSLGAAIVSLLLIDLVEEFREKIHCWCYGCPHTFNPELAEQVEKYMTTVIVGHDMIGRTSVKSMFALRAEMVAAVREAAQTVEDYAVTVTANSADASLQASLQANRKTTLAHARLVETLENLQSFLQAPLVSEMDYALGRNYTIQPPEAIEEETAENEDETAETVLVCANSSDSSRRAVVQGRRNFSPFDAENPRRNLSRVLTLKKRRQTRRKASLLENLGASHPQLPKPTTAQTQLPKPTTDHARPRPLVRTLETHDGGHHHASRHAADNNNHASRHAMDHHHASHHAADNQHHASRHAMDRHHASHHASDGGDHGSRCEASARVAALLGVRELAAPFEAAQDELSIPGFVLQVSDVPLDTGPPAHDARTARKCGCSAACSGGECRCGVCCEKFLCGACCHSKHFCVRRSRQCGNCLGWFAQCGVRGWCGGGPPGECWGKDIGRPYAKEVRLSAPDREEYADLKVSLRMFLDHIPDNYHLKLEELNWRVNGERTDMSNVSSETVCRRIANVVSFFENLPEIADDKEEPNKSPS